MAATPVTLDITEVAWLAHEVFAKNGGVAGLASAAVATAIVMGESGGNTGARRDASANPLGGNDRGLWQFNDDAHPDISDDIAYDAYGSFRAAYRVSDKGTDWTCWAIARPDGKGKCASYAANNPRRSLDLAAARAALADRRNPAAKLIEAGHSPLYLDGPYIGTDSATDVAVSAVNGALGAWRGITSWTEGATKLLGNITDASWWRRLGIGAIGIALIYVAVIIATRGELLDVGTQVLSAKTGAKTGAK
jgi:hypothetical protein